MTQARTMKSRNRHVRLRTPRCWECGFVQDRQMLADRLAIAVASENPREKLQLWTEGWWLTLRMADDYFAEAPSFGSPSECHGPRPSCEPYAFRTGAIRALQ